ncbi:MAG TPA: hypothetical protein VHW67_03655 [Solirubrobacteraceae bacterium]|nr:hypothetical protein [Solirubrobacteraceae bacterium]
MLLVAALAILTLLAGCGSSDNGVASKSPKEILQASKAAAISANSVHVVGVSKVQRSSFTIDAHLARDRARSRISLLGSGYEAIRIGGTVYVKGPPAFYTRLGARLGKPLHVPRGTWLKAPAGSGPLGELAALTDLPKELNRVLSTSAYLTKGVSTTIDGQKAIALKEKAKLYEGVLYVASTGKPYPLLFLKNGGRERGRTSFTGWDQDVSLSAPSPSVGVDSLTR